MDVEIFVKKDIEVERRVQAVASQAANKDTIPLEFIRTEEEQPALSTYNGPIPEIPVIDLNDDQNNLIRSISNASQEWGFFQIINHGIPMEIIENLQHVGKEFFELPIEEKEAYARPVDSPTLEGYGTKLQKEVDGKKNWVDYLFHNIWPPSQINYQFWPKNPHSYREVNEEYAKYLIGVVDKLLMLLSLGLGLEGNVIKEALGGDELEYLLKINYYPPCPRPDVALGVSPHTDMSAITVLVPNEIQGLQVSKNNLWIEAKYIPNALIIHIGDQVEILSNGKYKSVYHRTTVNKDNTRMSWPVFCSPPQERVVGPLPQMVNQQNPLKFKSKKYKDYQYCENRKELIQPTMRENLQNHRASPVPLLEANNNDCGKMDMKMIDLNARPNRINGQMSNSHSQGIDVLKDNNHASKSVVPVGSFKRDTYK